MKLELIDVLSKATDAHEREHTFFFKSEKGEDLIAFVKDGSASWARWYQVLCGLNTCKKDGRRMFLDGLNQKTGASATSTYMIDPESPFVIELQDALPPAPFYPDPGDTRPEKPRRDING